MTARACSCGGIRRDNELCDKCGRSAKQTTNAKHARGNPSERGYNRTWQRLTNRIDGYLSDHPLCVCCEAVGKVKAADVVDHIVPGVDSPELFYEPTNWQGLCYQCDGRHKRPIERKYKGDQVRAVWERFLCERRKGGIGARQGGCADVHAG